LQKSIRKNAGQKMSWADQPVGWLAGHLAGQTGLANEHLKSIKKYCVFLLSA